MKKIVLFLLCCIALCDHSHAQVVFDFSTDDAYTLFGLSGFSAAPSGQPAITDGDITSDVSTTSSDVTVTVTANPNGSVNRMWTGSLRLYGGTMTVSASRKNITAIKFTLNSHKWGANNSADCGTLETGSWAGNASTVVITIAANTQIKKMEVYQEGDDTPVTIDWTSSATTPLTVAQVLRKGTQLDEGADSGKEVYVKGKISQITEIGTVNESTGEPYGNATYSISDDGSTSSELVVFRGFGLNGAKLAQGDINVGDEVVVVGKIKNFKNQDGSTTLEINQGNKLYSLNGQTEGDDTPGPDPDPQPGDGTGSGTLADPYNFVAANNVAAALESGAKTDDVYVKGKISEIKYSFDAQHGTATFFITDDGQTADNQFQVYSTYYLGNRAWVEGDTQIQVGDEVVICGKIVNYNGNTPVTSAKESYIYSLNGQTGGDTPEPEFLELPTIARAKAAATNAGNGVNAIFKANDLLVAYVNGKSVYVFDGTDGLRLYANSAATNEGIKTGDKVTADFKGQLKVYNGLTEIAVASIENLTVNSSNNTVTPQTITIADITNSFTDYENELVTIKDLSPAANAWASRNITFTDDVDNELVVRDNWSVAIALTFDTSKAYSVTGFVAIYANATASTVQLYPRSAEDIDNGEAPVVYEPTGDGQLSNAYTVEDVRHLGLLKPEQGAPAGWVSGYIVGYVNGQSYNNGCVFSAEAPAAAPAAHRAEGEEPQVSNTNILLSDDPSCTDPAKCIPVQLANKLGMREALSLRDNPSYLHKKVWVEGTLTPYFSVAGVKEVVDWSFDGETWTTGIGKYYTITYIVDNALYSSCQILKGSSIVPPSEPQKEGYTFSGWDNLPTTMPNHDVTVTGSFIVNQYTITYKIDGNVYETQTVDYGATINSPNPPELIGYTFKWYYVPAKMPAKDITIEGRYVPNLYKITYWVDDVSYKVVDVAYGANIVAETDPEKEGYTFSGWSEMPTTMPAHDVTVTGSFTINTYKVIYMVNGEEYKLFEVEYGANVPIAEALEREGYTFSGWSMIPATMPAHDIVITASFTKGAYKLIYIVDGEVYKILSYDFEDGITPESAPVKEGYTFSGWSEIPETMPANDVAVTGTFSINHYTLTLMVGDIVYETLTLDYASSIVLPDMPALTGYTFSWGEAPATMPAKDLTITGEYTPISYNVTYLINGQFYAIVKLPYGTTITPPDVPEHDGLTFAWIDVPATMPAHDITIEGTYTDGLMEVKAGMSASGIYNLSGQRLSKPQRGVNIINGKKIVVK